MPKAAVTSKDPAAKPVSNCKKRDPTPVVNVVERRREKYQANEDPTCRLVLTLERLERVEVDPC